MTFGWASFQTDRINEVAGLIYHMGIVFRENKNRTSGNNSNLSCEVGMTRFELATPRPPDVCATGLRYIPFYFGKSNLKKLFFIFWIGFLKVLQLFELKVFTQ
jgi:hypothetical protein